MKNQVLSIEQMKHLKELGVDTSKASMYWNMPTIPDYKHELGIVGINANLKSAEECNIAIGSFTLQDMLEMMPKQLKRKVEEYRTPIDCVLIIDVSSNCVAYEYSQWGRIGSAESFSDDTLLNSTYKALCWLVENGHLPKKEECHVCGKTDVELIECECCGELYCEDCSSSYNQFTQIDYNCCKPCSKRERE